MGLMQNYTIFRPIICNHLKQISPRLMCSRIIPSKEISEPPSANVQDYLLQNIRSSTDSENLLKMVGKHHSIMNSRHVMLTLKSLFDLRKSENCNSSSQEIINNPNFLKLCKRLKIEARGIGLNDTVEALKIISHIGVPEDSTIVQVLLQILRHEINNLSLHHIIFIDFVMRNFKKTPLVDALKIALPLVFQAQLNLKMTRDNPAHMAEFLKYACKIHISESSISFIIECLEKISDDIDAKTAKDIVWALLDTKKEFPVANELINICWNIIVNNIDKYSYQDIVGLSSLMLRKCYYDKRTFYHEDFVNSCVKFVTKNYCSFEEGTWILKKLTRLNHVNTDILDYLGEKIINNPEVIEKCSIGSLITLLTGMANANYKPLGWECFRDALLKNKILECKDTVKLPWIKIALHMARMDIFNSDLLEFVFNEDFLQQFLSREYKLLDELQLLLLYQAVVQLHPSYKGPLPPHDIIQKVIDRNGDHVQDFPLKSALEQSLGGPSYVQTKLVTKLGHYIDHAIVMRKGGFPVALNQTASNSKILLEDLVIPSDNQIILIACLPESWYAVNCPKLLSVPSLMLLTLEALGHSVLPIPMNLWHNLPDYEKIPYLMQNIRLKCESYNDEAAAVY